MMQRQGRHLHVHCRATRGRAGRASPGRRGRAGRGRQRFSGGKPVALEKRLPPPVPLFPSLVSSRGTTAKLCNGLTLLCPSVKSDTPLPSLVPLPKEGMARKLLMHSPEMSSAGGGRRRLRGRRRLLLSSLGSPVVAATSRFIVLSCGRRLLHVVLLRAGLCPPLPKNGSRTKGDERARESLFSSEEVKCSRVQMHARERETRDSSPLCARPTRRIDTSLLLPRRESSFRPSEGGRKGKVVQIRFQLQMSRNAC